MKIVRDSLTSSATRYQFKCIYIHKLHKPLSCCCKQFHRLPSIWRYPQSVVKKIVFNEAAVSSIIIRLIIVKLSKAESQ